LRLAAVALALLCLSPPAERPLSADEQTRIGDLVALVQDVEEDYAEAAEAIDPAPRARAAALARTMVERARAIPQLAAFVPRLGAVADEIAAGVQPVYVQEACRALADEIARMARLPRAPRVRPDLERGRWLYAVACVACHGPDGRSRAPLALAQDPPPADLLDASTMNGLSPYRVYNALTYGVWGTAMPSYEGLSDGDRWSLAFFVFSLRHGPCRHSTAEIPVAWLATATDSAVVARYGEPALACARQLR
jgi:high-affinity iron transporter